MSGAGIVVIAGPTGSGKSALGLVLAERLGGEIVSADSVQVYRGFDVGSAKATVAERARVRHHGIDVRAPGAQYTAGDFARDADRAIAEIGARGALPIVVGGTGLYLKALLSGLSPAAPSSPEVRASLEAAWEAEGGAALWARLVSGDPAYAARIHPNDRVRVVRALEVMSLTGGTFTAATEATHGFREARHRALGLALTAPRAWLHARVEARARAMVASGIVEEVRGLLAAGCPPDAPALGSIGYREALAVVLGEADGAGLAEAIAASTRAYVRRQLVWLRGQGTWRWLRADLLDVDGLEAAVAAWRGGEAVAPGWETEAEALDALAGVGEGA